MSAALAILASVALTAGQDASLVHGEVIVNVVRQDAQIPGQVDAWIDIPAPPQLVWDTMNDCEHVASFIPNLVSCRVIERDPHGAYEIREHVADPGWLIANVRSRFRADLTPPHVLRFSQIDGDFEVMEGQWTLAAMAAGGTRLRYEARLKPRMWVPDFAVRQAIESDAPRTLRALRDEVLRRKGLVPPAP